MKAFMKKEWLETVRSGKFIILTIIFVLFGIMNPAISKLLPWMMENLMAEQLSEAGIVVTGMRVDALTSWTQFFKNIPMALIAFVLIYGGIFTKEYQSGTLTIVVAKGLQRYKVVFAKTFVTLSMWTFSYWLCFGITYAYNWYFWDNGVVCSLFPAVAFWWLFGVWIVCLTVFFSVMFRNISGVLSGTCAVALAAYIIRMFTATQDYTPAMLMNSAELLIGTADWDSYIKAVLVTVGMSLACILISIPIMNKKKL